ncbi:MAG: hypothetical protein AB8F78_03770 [Saprospiraceae bacterium]
MRLENRKPTCISFDAYCELAERDSELWELVDRPTGAHNSDLRDRLLHHWQGFKRVLKAYKKQKGRLPTREEAAALFAESFADHPSH